MACEGKQLLATVDPNACPPTPSKRLAKHPNNQLCSPNASGNNSSLLFLLQPKEYCSGGLTISLNKNVPYTNNANPRTCSHLNVSQPRPSETIQMKSVRQVSIVEREVAETVRVTERPKKLNPLQRDC